MLRLLTPLCPRPPPPVCVCMASQKLVRKSVAKIALLNIVHTDGRQALKHIMEPKR
jgi:hypothetical protein